ncbi:MAG: hypothetical protein ACIAXF_01705 [Phycisphaerales bacterium JB063]
MRSQALLCRTVALVLLGLVGVAMSVGSARAETPPEDKVIRLTITLQSGQVVTGTITEYDEIGFTLTAPNENADGPADHRLMWTAIPVDAFDRYWRFFESPEGDGEALLRLGILLSRHRDGERLAGVAFDEALEADASLADQIEQARNGEAPGEGPRFVGIADPAMWGPLDETLMEQSVEQLRAFCQRTQEELGVGLSLYESPRFMICTDLDAEQVQRWGEKLTETYRHCAQLVGEDPDGNLFRGKCLILVFSERADYLRFQRVMHDTDAHHAGGLCHGFGNGFVHIAVTRRPSARETSHVIVHEVVHGFLHRYRSPVHVPAWINEGLAEYIAHLVEPPTGAGLYRRALLRLEGEQMLGEDFFEGEDLQAWQYDVAGALTQFMLERSVDRYVMLIDGVKDGTPWDEALESAYRMEYRRLVQRFKRRLDQELSRRLEP